MVDEFSEFYWAQLPRLRRFLGRRVNSNETRKDLETTIMTAAWRRFRDVRDEQRSFGWLAGIAGGAIANERRAERRRRALTDRVAADRAVGAAAQPPDAMAGVEGLDPRVSAVLAALGDGDRELLLLHDWDACDYGEMAVAFGLNEAAVRKRLSRARQRFVERYEALGASEGGRGER